MAFLMKNALLRCINSRHLLVPSNNVAKRLESISTLVLWQKTNFENAGTQKKSSKTQLKITLIQNQKDVSVTSLEEAKNLAKRRSMQLVMVQKMDSKTQRPVYKLLTSAERLQEELSDLKTHGKDGSVNDKAVQKKSEKTLNIGSRISEHDLSSRLKNISKWLDKRHEVRILIQGSDSDTASSEKIFKTIEESIKTPQIIGKVVQKRTKGAAIKFSILPIQPESNINSDKSSSATNQ